MNNVTLTIDGISVTVPSDYTILEAAKEASAAPATDAPKAEETSDDVKTEETASESDAPAAE